MKQFFARLNPTERRFVVGVGVAFFLVINFVWIVPHFWDWGQTRDRMKKASDALRTFAAGTNEIPGLQKEIDKYQRQGQPVPQEDQALQFVRVIQNQAAQSGVIPVSMGSQARAAGTTNNPYFVEQIESVVLQSTDKQLVDFLYRLGAGDSQIRVRALTVQPDQSHTMLSTRATLVASYQRKLSAPRSGSTPAARPVPAPTKAATPATAKAVTPPPGAQKPSTMPVLKPPMPARSNNPGIPAPAKNLTPQKK